MKTLKNLLVAVITVVSIGFLATSCNDKFSEKDLLELQLQLGTKEDSLNAARQLAALNAAGEMVSYQVKVVDTDGTPVPDLEVSLGAAATDGTLDKQTLTTDAEGQVYFSRVAVGGNNLTITGSGILDANLTVNFGDLQQGVHYEIINGNVVPKPVVENSVITVIGTGAATATVQGVATIETDLTNSTPEVPQNVTIVADFDDNLVKSSSVSLSYFFATNSSALSLGSAVVDNTTGAYSMTVPAGVRFDITIPNIQANQRIAVNGYDGQDLPRPEYRDILTNFGPSYGADNIPTVPGARVVFDAPSAAGEGFTFGSFAREGRAIQTFTLNANSTTITQPYEPSSDIITQVTNRGAGYFNSPTVTITDAGSGTGAYAEAWIELAISGLTLNDAGSGYAANTTYSFNLVYDEIDQNGTNPNQVWDTNVIDIDTDGSGVFQTSAITTALTNAMDNADQYFDVANLEQISDNISNLRLVNSSATTDAIIDVSAATGRVYYIRVFDGGNDYTMPSFAFSGGGATTQAAMDILEFGTQWTFDVDNTGVTSPYTFPPTNVYFEYNNITTGSAGVSSSSNGQNVEDGQNSTLVNLLKADGSGNLQFIDPTASYRTSFYASSTPIVRVEETEAIPAARFIRPYEINTEGQVTGMSTGGWATDFTSSNGSGYSSQFNVTVEPSATGAPGSGAIIALTGGTNQANGEYQWGGSYLVQNGGSGYLIDLNVHNGNVVSGDNRIYYNAGGDVTNVELKAGTTHVVDIRYGTGDKSVSVY